MKVFRLLMTQSFKKPEIPEKLLTFHSKFSLAVLAAILRLLSVTEEEFA